MYLKKFDLLALLIFISFGAAAQDTLPRFSAINRGSDRILVSWTNPYAEQIRQLSIQRSYDSLKNYKTILTVPDPTAPQNGYVDTKAANDHMFYRLYILLDSGKYIFSKSKRPVIDAGFGNAAFSEMQSSEKSGITSINKLQDLKEAAIKKNDRVIIVKTNERLVGAILESSLKRFRDSMSLNTRDTIFMKTPDTIVIRLFNPREYFKPSQYVFTERDGNIKILLPDAHSKNYAVKFFEEDNTEVFEIKEIRESLLILDKTNFIHSGWFTFELYLDGKLKEKHKLFVPKDF
jgi:hypothetical protein